MPFGLKRLELVEFALKRPLQPSFLRREVAEIALVGTESVRLNECLADLRQFFRKQFLKLDLAESKKVGFEHRAAIETPAGIGEQVDERGFFFADRCEAFHESLAMRLIGIGILARKQDGAASETGLEGIEGRTLFAMLGTEGQWRAERWLDWPRFVGQKKTCGVENPFSKIEERRFPGPVVKEVNMYQPERTERTSRRRRA